jgi:hypothetical protein
VLVGGGGGWLARPIVLFFYFLYEFLSVVDSLEWFLYNYFVFLRLLFGLFLLIFLNNCPCLTMMMMTMMHRRASPM